MVAGLVIIVLVLAAIALEPHTSPLKTLLFAGLVIAAIAAVVGVRS